MALKIPKGLQDKWERRLAAEGLAPLTTYSADAVKQRRIVQRAMSPQRVQAEAYYAKAHKFLRRIELAHAVWSLHCEGQGRDAIAKMLAIPPKVVRLVLERLQTLVNEGLLS